MTKFKFLSLIITLLLVSCNSQKEYSDLDKLYSDFVIYLKDSNTENLKEYCYKITPDMATINYMKEHEISYRGIPNRLEKRKMKPSFISDKYYEFALAFKEKLKEKGQLANLKYVGREKDGEELVDEKLKIYATEIFILMESNGDTIKCELGEIYKINNNWKSFTKPKIEW